MSRSHSLNAKQFAAVSALSGPQRYQHFVGRVADWQCVWSLRDQDGWVSAADDDGNLVYPFWPHPDYAEACSIGNWAGSSPDCIEIHQFLDRWLPGMSKDGVSVAVFPTALVQGVVVPPLQLQQAIQDELSRIE